MLGQSKLEKLKNFVGGRRSTDHGTSTPAAAGTSTSTAGGLAEATVVVTPGQKLIPAKEQGELPVLVTVEAPTLESEEVANRPPLDIIAVIDRSGSMSDGKLDLVKKTMEFLLLQLKATDRLAVVSFDTGVRTEFGLTALTDANRGKIDKNIKAMQPGSMTNLSGGLYAGLNIAAERPAGDKTSHACSVLLFTDGQANHGDTVLPAILAGMGRIKDAKKPAVFTFGYGSDHNEELLKSIAEAQAGLYYFLDNPDQIPSKFGDCVGGLLSVVAQNVTVTIEAVAPCTITSVQAGACTARTVTQGSKYEAEVGDLYSEEKKNFIVMCKYPAGTAPAAGFGLVTVKMSHFNIVAMKQAADVTVRAEVERVDRALTDEEKKVGVEVETQLLRYEYLTEVKASREEADRGEYNAAQVRMGRLNMKMKASHACNSEAVTRLAAETELYSGMLNNPAQWKSAGGKYAAAQSRAHACERGQMEMNEDMVMASGVGGEAREALASKAMYANKSKKAMGSKVSAFFSK